jgi:hypothetical protein
MDTKVTLTKNADGYAHAHGIEKFVISLSGGFPIAAAADVSIEPANEDGKIYARVSVGNQNDGKMFDTFEAAAEFVDRFINPPQNRRLSDLVRANGRLMESKYDGTDCLGQSYSAGENIYFYASKNSNAKFILKAE